MYNLNHYSKLYLRLRQEREHCLLSFGQEERLSGEVLLGVADVYLVTRLRRSFNRHDIVILRFHHGYYFAQITCVFFDQLFHRAYVFVNITVNVMFQ